MSLIPPSLHQLEGGSAISSAPRIGGAWQPLLAKVRDGRYKDEPVVDSFANKKSKVVIVTPQRLLYVNSATGAVRWAVRKEDILAISQGPGRWNAVLIRCRRQVR